VVCNSDVDLQGVYVGEELEFEALVDNVPPAVPTSYRWQINNTGVWNDISEYEVPSAVTSKLQITADKETYYGSVRCIVDQIDIDNPESCQLEFVSAPIRFSVSDAEFYYTESPAKKSTICEGGEFELYFAYFGIIVDGYWTHNGEIMYDENGNRYTEQILTLKNITPFDEGIYNYVATAYTRNEDGEVEMTEHITRDAELYVISQNSILEQPEKETFAPMGSTIILEFVADVRGEYDYQWYRKTVAGDVALENNHKYNGVKANALVINYLDPSDFTYNGDYFYCKINGQCGITTTEPAYLFTQETQLYIAQQPQDALICLREDKSIELNVDILQKSSTLEYQWYKDDQALVDDTRIKGSKTSHLVISPAAVSDEGIYWVVSREVATGSEVKSNEVTVSVKELTLLEVKSDTLMYVHEGDSIELYRVKFRSSSGKFNVDVSFNGEIIHKGTHKIQTGTPGSVEVELFDQNLTNIKPEECGLYEIRWYNDCDTILHRVRLVLVDQDGNPVETVTSSIKDYKNVLDFNISPNPVNNKINLVFESSESNTRIDLLDISGSNLVTVFDGMLESGRHTISYDLSKLNLSSGTYFIKLVQGGSVQVKPFIFTK
ncbi:MAG: T9SS type A sorting domain-containing protein, partial [Bacteroidetes bacterium]|nr:T9SS type A sorting domain-containing protein [Bacteroidota bacterium]